MAVQPCMKWNPSFKRNLLLQVFTFRSYLFKVINKNTKTMCKIFSELTKRPAGRPSVDFCGRFEQILHIDLVFLLLTFADFFLSGKEINTINPKIIVYYIFLVGIIFESLNPTYCCGIIYMCIYLLCMYMYVYFLSFLDWKYPKN